MTSSTERPPMWIGHVAMKVPDIDATRIFFLELGMREIENMEHLAILEMRAGTHLIVQATNEPVVPGKGAPFDLMVEDVEAMHARLTEAGLAPGPLESNPVHQYFLIREPGGHDLQVNSSHNSGLPV